MSFLHGVETIESFVGPVPIRGVRSAVIGIVGTAPVQTVDPDDKTINKLVLLTNDRDDAKYFGAETTGYSLPTALKRLRENGAGLILAVNVFNPATHVTSGTPDPSTVTASDIVGTVDVGGVRSGMQVWLEAASKYKFTPRLLLTPGFGSNTTVKAALLAIAPKVRGMLFLDGTVGMTVSAAIASRTGTGEIFNTQSDRAVLCYPNLKAPDPGGALSNQGLSTFLAGLIAGRDVTHGYWWSPSNAEFKGAVDVERSLTWALNDQASEVNLLNEAGICTYAPAGGIMAWGNRTAASPTITTPNNFISVRRTADVLEDSIEQAQLQFLDHPLNKGLIDTIVEMVNGFLREQRGKGAILDGNCWFDPDDNPITQLADGNAVYRYDFLPPIPSERVTMRAVINTNYLAALLAA